MRNVKDRIIKSTVGQAIDHLIKQAEKEYGKRPNLSKRYAKMAWELVKKNKVRLTPEQKHKFCRKCHELWIPGKTITVIFNPKNNLFVLTCKCGYARKTGSQKTK